MSSILSGIDLDLDDFEEESRKRCFDSLDDAEAAAQDILCAEEEQRDEAAQNQTGQPSESVADADADGRDYYADL
eukprot:scaffold578729_cov46-Prasinocladus_malaysianus.AAC.1